MSYCRWSSDGFGCDLYCYESVHGGFVTHVANARYVGKGECPSYDFSEGGDLGASIAAQRAWLDAATLVDIGGPCDGQSYHDETLADMRDRIVELGGAGYRFPEGLIESLDEEIADQNRNAGGAA